MNGSCSSTNAPKASRAKRKSRATAAASKKRTAAKAAGAAAAAASPSASTASAAVEADEPSPAAAKKRKRSASAAPQKSKKGSVDDLPDTIGKLREATLKLQYPLQTSLGKNNKQSLRLVTSSVDLIRCMLVESSWALSRRKNPSESFKLWFSTHDVITKLIDESGSGSVAAVNDILAQLNATSLNYGMRESNYFEWLGDACNSLFKTELLHNKKFDPEFVTLDPQKIKDSPLKARDIFKKLYKPSWAKMSETLNKISHGAALIGGRGDMIDLFRCADVVLNRSKDAKTDSLIKNATERTVKMSKLGASLEPKGKTQEAAPTIPHPFVGFNPMFGAPVNPSMPHSGVGGVNPYWYAPLPPPTAGVATVPQPPVSPVNRAPSSLSSIPFMAQTDEERKETADALTQFRHVLASGKEEEAEEKTDVVDLALRGPINDWEVDPDEVSPVHDEDYVFPTSVYFGEPSFDGTNE